MSLSEIVNQLVEMFIKENPQFFFLEVSIDTHQKIKMVVDNDKGVNVEDIVKVSRYIEHNIDREIYDFALEVLSPGAFSEITMPRQYLKNIGRIMKFDLMDSTVLKACLDEVTDAGLNVSWQSREPKSVGKGKVTVIHSKFLAFEQIKTAHVEINF